MYENNSCNTGKLHIIRGDFLVKLRIEWIYKTPKGMETTFHVDALPIAQALLFAEDFEKTGRMKSILFFDEADTTWTTKEIKRYLKEIETEPHNITVYFDGGFDLESKKAGLGCVIYYEQNGKSYRVRKNAPSDEMTSNNEAEYAALYLGIQELEYLNVHHIPVEFIGDSQVVINQMSEQWPVLETDLARWAHRIDEKLESLAIQPTYKNVPRKRNAEADRLATQALNGVSITAKTEV